MRLEVNPFRMGTDKEAALKPLEESAEVFGAWQEYEEFWHNLYMVEEDVRWMIEEQLENEIADCITACVNLAERHGLDLQTALERVEKHNRERGRYGSD